MRRLKFILFIVKIYFSILNNLNKIEEINLSLSAINKERANFLQMLALYKSVQNRVLEYTRGQLTSNRTCARRLIGESTFWEIECQRCGEDFFKRNFRMKRSAFQKLCCFLEHLRRQDTGFHNTICLEKRVAIALYALGSSAEYRSIANLFGVGKSTVCVILLEFCREVWKLLHPIYLNSFPLTEDKIKECVYEFKQIGFPQCMGAVDGCHIEIHPKQEESVDYINYKGWFSIVLLALVDARYRFLYINVGSPGRCNDSKIFENSSLKKHLEKCSLLNSMSVQLGNCIVPVVILGDSAFRFSKYLMKPFPFCLDKTPEQKTFNYQLSKARRVVENAFGHLKARFRRVGKGIDNRIDNANAVIKACCVLHNFLIAENDAVAPSWLAEQNVIEKSRSYPQYTSNSHQNLTEAESIRQAFSTYFKLLGAADEEDDGNVLGSSAVVGNGVEDGDNDQDWSTDDAEVHSLEYSI